ncbi:MAG: hypothetical protein AB1689_04290 [Thermodesulfobacteriota bacterium]
MKRVVAASRRSEGMLTVVFPWALVVGVLASLAAAGAVAIAETSWIGRTFPGFFVLPNRVVASIARPDWGGTRNGALFQRLVVEVDGAPVATSGDVYRLADEHRDETVSYTLRDGARSDVVAVPTQVFSRLDYLAVFGAYAATGLLYLLLGLFAVAVLPTATGRAILVLGGVAGVYSLSAAGMYDAGATLRLHALAEALFPAALVQLSLTYPGPAQLATRPATPLAGWVGAAWFLSAALALAYQLLLYEPSAYSALHAASETYLGLAGLGLAVRLVCELATAPSGCSPLLRGATAGAVLGLGLPAVVVGLSGLTGGVVPVNVVVTTAFLFPLCLGWGLLREQRMPAGAPAVS